MQLCWKDETLITKTAFSGQNNNNFKNNIYNNQTLQFFLTTYSLRLWNHIDKEKLKKLSLFSGTKDNCSDLIAASVIRAEW